jgi:tRNA (guanine37-N1)-methyltransferase
MALKDILESELSAEEMKKLNKAFDVIGDVAIVEIPPELRKKEKLIASAVKKTNPHIKTVLKKLGERKGKFRLRGFKILAGKETETMHKEYGCFFRLDVTKAYFSPRESTERQRIAAKVKPGETVLVMFAGIGPYAIQIAKKQPLSKTYAIEINPEAVEYMKENVRINKVGDRVVPILGDVKEKSENFYGKCDRIVMPLPKGAHRYLKNAIMCTKPGGIVHFYYWSREEDLFTQALDLVQKAAKKTSRSISVLDKRKTLPYGPGIWKICIDFSCL